MPLDSVYDVFISYSSKDKAWVRGELLTSLEHHGLRVIIDFRDFQLGAPTVKEIERAILYCRKTLLVLSPSSPPDVFCRIDTGVIYPAKLTWWTTSYWVSRWTDFENLIVQMLDPPNQTLRLIPLFKEKCELPLRVHSLTHVNCVIKMVFGWCGNTWRIPRVRESYSSKGYF